MEKSFNFSFVKALFLNKKIKLIKFLFYIRFENYFLTISFFFVLFYEFVFNLFKCPINTFFSSLYYFFYFNYMIFLYSLI